MKSKIKKSKSIIKYLPVLLILLSITIMVGSTFAYFTDRKDTSSDLTFSKVELSSETTLGINGEIRDLIPGSRIVDTPIAFSKAIDSEAIYVRAKISFTLPEEYEDDEGMLSILEGFRLSSDFNIVSGVQYGAVWSAKDGSYYYLLDSGDNTNLKRVDTIDTYTLSREIIVPRDLKNLDDNAQYMKGVNFHIAFEAIQADNVSAKLDDTKQTFDLVFPPSEIEEKFAPTFKVTFMGADLENAHNTVKVNDGQLATEPTLAPEGESERAIFAGWYIDKELTTEFDFTTPISEDITLYPKYTLGDTLTIMNTDGETVMMRVLVPDGETTVEPTGSAYVDENGTSTHVMLGYYTDASYTNEFKFGTTINQSYTLYPQLLAVSEGLEFTPLTEAVATSSAPDFRVSNEGTTSYSVADGTCADAYIVVPDYYQGKPVTQVTASGFSGNTTMTNIYLPKYIHTINARAFNSCNILESVEIGENVKTLGNNAFYSCSKLSKIDYNAILLNDLSTGNNIFYNAGKGSTGITFTIGNKVEKIAANLCYPTGNSSYCPNITDIIFEEGSICSVIGTQAFNFCSSIKRLEICSTITTIGDNAFYGCRNLEELRYNAVSVTDLVHNTYNYKYNGVFNYAGQATANGFRFIIGANVERIPANLFYGYSTYYSDATPKLGSIEFEKGSVCTSIGSNAFRNCNTVTNIIYNAPNVGIISSVGSGVDECVLTIGNEVTKIPTNAFNGTKITKIIFEEGTIINEIGNGAFANNRITEFNISKDVTQIGHNPFYGCDNLILTIDENNENYYIDGNCLIDRNSKTLISGFATSEIPTNIDALGNYAFSSSKNLNSIVLPNNIKTIGEYAFSSCSSLVNITMSNDVETINNYAFSSCSSLVSIELPEKLKTLGANVFSSCSKLEEIKFNAVEMNDLTQYNKIFYYAGKSGNGINVVVGNNVKKIPAHLFNSSGTSSDNPKIVSLEFEDNSVCTSIGVSAFQWCVSMERIEIPSSVTTIGNNAFESARNLQELRYNATSVPNLIHNTSTYQYNEVFNNAGQATANGFRFIIGANVERIPGYLFYCYDPKYDAGAVPKVGTIEFEEGSVCTEIGTLAFNKCNTVYKIICNAENLTSGSLSGVGSSVDECELIIGKNITHVNGMFSGTKITKVTFEEGSQCTSIGNSAFANNRITEFNITENITQIGTNPFYGCNDLVLTIDEGNTNYYIDGNCLIDGSNKVLITGFATSEIPTDIQVIGEYAFSGTALTSITIPNNVVTISKNAFSSCTALVSVTMSENVETIGEYAFSYCTALEKITIPQKVKTLGANAFSSCSKLVEIRFNAESMDNLAQYNRIFYYAGKSGSGINVIVGNNVTKIPAHIFNSSGTSSDNPKIISLEFEENSICTTIGESAFNWCGSMIKLEIPTSIITVGNNAFNRALKLEEIRFNAIAMDNLVNTTYPPVYNGVFDYAGQGTTNGFRFIVGAEVTKIPAYLFYGYNTRYYSDAIPKIGTIEFEEGSVCTTIGAGAFSYCKTVTKIVYNAPNLTSSLSNVSSGVTECELIIGKGMTALPTTLGSVKFTSIKFEEGSVCDTINATMFANRADLLSVELPSSITTIADDAFTGTTAYILCPNDTVAGYASGKGSTNVYVVDSTTDFSAVTFTDATSGAVNGTYNDGTNYYVRTGEEGSYVYYKKYTA